MTALGYLDFCSLPAAASLFRPNRSACGPSASFQRPLAVPLPTIFMTKGHVSPLTLCPALPEFMPLGRCFPSTNSDFAHATSRAGFAASPSKRTCRSNVEKIRSTCLLNTRESYLARVLRRPAVPGQWEGFLGHRCLDFVSHWSISPCKISEPYRCLSAGVRSPCGASHSETTVLGAALANQISVR